MEKITKDDSLFPNDVGVDGGKSGNDVPAQTEDGHGRTIFHQL